MENIVQNPQETELTSIARELAWLLGHATGKNLMNERNAVNFFQSKWIGISVLKRSSLDKKNDAYILGLTVKNRTLGIKIHPDIFQNCREVYQSPELLWSLVNDNDIGEVLSTWTIDGYRVVFFRWKKGVNPKYLLKNHPAEFHPKIQDALTLRVNSLLKLKNDSFRPWWNFYQFCSW